MNRAAGRLPGESEILDRIENNRRRLHLLARRECP